MEGHKYPALPSKTKIMPKNPPDPITAELHHTTWRKSGRPFPRTRYLLSQDLHPILASLWLSSLLSEFFFHLPGDQSDSLWSVTSRNDDIFLKYGQRNNCASWGRGHVGQTKSLSKYQRKLIMIKGIGYLNTWFPHFTINSKVKPITTMKRF